ncbi:hypothetical protein A343_2402 [Porphyromonas gingivalis JCVI SC001]|uniref:Uncharacterized protein n=1 Tax=Porphyromonas gingivalis F0570 TaxID=1227271 RepID=A0A0E2M349_PORGN|nr:hypothetical protein A343_2402 [Porphyromonas gingivalis JCVI SC001]ERJ64132.1 hypothetical protein HMPREF1555_02019 [Porphyromonas gingivalis F0570]
MSEVFSFDTALIILFFTDFRISNLLILWLFRLSDLFLQYTRMEDIDREALSPRFFAGSHNNSSTAFLPRCTDLSK